MSIHAAIIKRLITHPRRVAMIDDLRSWKGYELLAGALHVASVLEREKASKHVGLLLPTCASTAFSALGAWWTGRVSVPLNFLLRNEELQYVVDDCETDTILASRKLVEHTGFEPRVKRLIYLEDLDFKKLPRPRWPKSASDDDLGVLLYTSGTSGFPKGVMLTHGNVRANVQQCIDGVGFGPDLTMLGVLPQFHSFGFTVLTALPLISGARVVFSARFVPTKIIDLFREHRPDAFVAIPSIYNALLSSKKAEASDFSNVRFLVSGGEPLPDAVFDGFEKRFGTRICEGYGLTETAPVTHWCLPEKFRRPSVGQPLPRVEQRIVDPDTGNVLGPGEEGEVRLRGPNVMKGYFKLPDETANAFDDDGFFRTGDIGAIDADNYLSITGRLKDMLIIGGENVFPREIESALESHEAVHSAGVVGRTDPMRGEVPIAFVQLHEGASVDDNALRAWCRDRLAGYKVPREVRFEEELPRSPTGKMLRRELRDRVAAEADAGGASQGDSGGEATG
jgi:long-chain acyl-CoA synthetase